MKKISFSTILLFIFSIVFLSACKDEETKTLLRFQTDTETYSLKNAKLYLRVEGEYRGAVDYTYRDYFISDGELIEGEGGWSVDDYTNATYFIGFELATAQPAVPGSGDYPLNNLWGNVTDGSNLGYFLGDFDDNTIDTPDPTPKSVIVITGGAEPDDTMTIKFSGKIAYRNGGVFTSFDGKLDFTGKVIDKRD